MDDAGGPAGKPQYDYGYDGAGFGLASGPAPPPPRPPIFTVRRILRRAARPHDLPDERRGAAP